jgi:hypothetical protein
VRSYQRVFRPERRIYQVQGHRIPVPGGVPLRWLGHATGSLLVVLALSSGSPSLSLALVLGAAGVGAWAAGVRGAAIGAWAGLAVALVGRLVLGGLDWPLRLVVLPALAATVATQATPDGRAAHRLALSWLGLWGRSGRRSLGRAAPRSASPLRLGGSVRVACDERSERLRRCRVRGPAEVSARAGVEVRRRRWPRRARVVARPATGDGAVGSLTLAAGEVLEVRR